MQTEFRFLDDGESAIVVTEEWRPMPDFPRYEVSNMGRIRNIATGLILGGTQSHNGYVHISLTKDGKIHTKLVHRLIALAFLEPPSPQHFLVNHKNKCRNDNRLSNLEWCTRSYNSKHARQK